VHLTALKELDCTALVLGEVTTDHAVPFQCSISACVGELYRSYDPTAQQSEARIHVTPLKELDLIPSFTFADGATDQLPDVGANCRLFDFGSAVTPRSLRTLDGLAERLNSASSRPIEQRLKANSTRGIKIPDLEEGFSRTIISYFYFESAASKLPHMVRQTAQQIPQPRKPIQRRPIK
jgi:hypothetical protein